MRQQLLFALASVPFFIHSLDYEMQSETKELKISKIKLSSKEEVGLHRDEFPRMVYAIQGGDVKRIHEDGSSDIVHFPTGQTIFLEADPIGKLHKGINISDNELEILVVELKAKKS